jgi:hypothetical protein
MYPMFIAGFLFVGLFFLVYRQTLLNRQEDTRIKDGLALTVHMKRIIDTCQKHRGTSNALLQGNEKVRAQLVSLQADIDALIASEESNNLKPFDQWASFIEHWPRLKKHALAGDLNSQNLVRQHSLMIDGQLSLLDDVMRAHDLHRMMLDRFTRISEICIDTLRVAETVGQTRAVGSGICAHGTCEGADKIILDFLRISVQATTTELIKEINGIKNNELQSELQLASRSIDKTVGQLLSIIDKDVIKDGQISVDSNDYFGVATKAIDEVLKVFGIIIHYASQKQRQMI